MQRPYNGFIMHIPEFRIQARDGRKKDGDGNPVTKKGDRHPNIINGYVVWETVQLADLAQTKKLFPEYKSMHSQVLQDVIQCVQTTIDNLCLT
ncbi:MAG: hypothetical protein F6K48_14345 [Okeania sp. SIO3H1]|nr:hypothetical protein [Okeania sp. SIO3H1]